MRPGRKAIQEIATASGVMLSFAAYALEALRTAHALAVVFAIGAAASAVVALIVTVSLHLRSPESTSGPVRPPQPTSTGTATTYRAEPGAIGRIFSLLRTRLASLVGVVLTAVLAGIASAWVLVYVGPDADGNQKPNPPAHSVAPASPTALTHTAKVIVLAGATVYTTALRLTPTSTHFTLGGSVRFASVCIGVPVTGAIWPVPDERWLKLGAGQFLAAARVSPEALASVHVTALCPGVPGNLRLRMTSHRLEITPEVAYRTLRLSVEAPHAGQVGFAVFELPARHWKTLGMGHRRDGMWALRYVKRIKGVVIAQACWALGVPATGYADEAPPQLRIIPGSTHDVVEAGQMVAAAESEAEKGVGAACRVPVREPGLVYAKPPTPNEPAQLGPSPLPPAGTTTTTAPRPTITHKEKVIHG